MTETSPHGAVPQDREKGSLPPVAPPRNHGHTVAAWVAMASVMVGATLVAVGFVLPAWWLAWTGLGVAVVGLLAGAALRKAGLGQPDARAAAPATDGTEAAR